MKVALIGDVHANLPALEAVLAHAREREVEAIWNVGDFVGYGAFPDEVVRRLRQVEAVSIVGNYDLKVLKFPHKQEKWKQSKQPEKWLAFKWAYENLSDESRNYLSSLPQEVRLEIAGKSILLTHASPASNEEPLTTDTPQERMQELAHLAQADVVVCGHSHQHFVRQVGGVWFINTGSVGRSDDGDPRAAYAILRLQPGRLAVRNFRVAYEVDSAVMAIRQHELPEAFAQMILRGRSLDGVIGANES